jgi:hypothetical protein
MYSLCQCFIGQENSKKTASPAAVFNGLVSHGGVPIMDETIYYASLTFSTFTSQEHIPH